MIPVCCMEGAYLFFVGRREGAYLTGAVTDH